MAGDVAAAPAGGPRGRGRGAATWPCGRRGPGLAAQRSTHEEVLDARRRRPGPVPDRRLRPGRLRLRRLWRWFQRRRLRRVPRGLLDPELPLPAPLRGRGPLAEILARLLRRPAPLLPPPRQA